MNNIKAFTLIELVSVMLISVILALGAARLAEMNAGLIKSANSFLSRKLELDVALSTIVKDLRSSAWVHVKDLRNIELHSHSRKDNILFTLDDKGDLYRKEGQKAGIVIAKGISGTEIFQGIGEERSSKRYNTIKIEFYDSLSRSSDISGKDIFYRKMYAVAGEDWDVIYIDPDNATIASQEGSRIKPYDNLAEVLSLGLSPDSKIFVLSGEHNITDNPSLTLNMMYFAPGTVYDFAQGASLTLKGDFCCAGTSQKRTVFRGNDWTGVVLFTQQNTVDLSYIELSGSRSGITTRPYSGGYDCVSDVVISGNFVHDNTFIDQPSGAYIGKAFSVMAPVNLTIYNNVFLNNDSVVGTIHFSGLVDVYNNSIEGVRSRNTRALYLTTSMANISCAYSTTKAISVHDNIIKNYTGAIYCGCRYNLTETPFKCDIFNNYIENTDTAFYYEGTLRGLFELKCYNNRVLTEKYGTIKVLSNRANPMNTISIENNSIECLTDAPISSAYPAIAITSRCDGAVISNNLIIKSYIQNGSENVTIKNNVIRDYSDYGFNGYCAGLFENNMLINTKGLGIIAGDVYKDIKLYNNTVVGGGLDVYYFYENTYVVYNGLISDLGVAMDIKNCIIWGGSGVHDNVKQHVRYSNVSNMEPDVLKNIYSEDPLFDDKYRPRAVNCRTKGENGQEMGAYGGPEGSGWERGVGAQ